MSLTFGMTVMPDPPFSRMLDLIQLAERNGFEYGWTYDSHILWQESYALLPIVARETKTIKLGHCVTNPGIRDPTITASWYATMQDLSGGRMVMGIGRGDSSRRVVGLKPVKVAEFERRLRMIKDLMNGRAGRVEREGADARVGQGAPRDPDARRRLRAARARRRGPRRRRRDHPARRPADHPVDHGDRARGGEGGGPGPGRPRVHRLRAEPHLGRHRRRPRPGALVPGDGLEPRHGPRRALRLRLRDPRGSDRLRQGARVLRLQGPQPGRARSTASSSPTRSATGSP